jgi:HK97 family phage major capsid protein
MKNVQQLRDERAEKIEALRSIDVVAEGEKRSLNADEKVKYDGILADIRNLDGDITRAEQREKLAIESVAAGAGTSHTEPKEAREFSLIKVYDAIINKRELTGLEKEMHQEAVKEARESGQQINGYGIPSFIVHGSQKRDNSVTMPTQPQDGSAVVHDLPGLGMVEPLGSRLITRLMGAEYHTGLVGGKLPLDAITQGAVSSWASEVGELTKSDIKFSKSELEPHRLGTYIKVSKQFLRQTSPSIERSMRQNLFNSIDTAIDTAAINGSGTGNEPLGILNIPGIGSVVLGTNGAAPTYEKLVALEAMVDGKNALLGKLGYVMTTAAKAKLKTTKLDAGSGLFVMPSNNELNGYKVGVTNVVPGNLTKGTGTDLSAIIFGNWEDLVIANWGGVDLFADPYTLATNGQVRIIVESFWDIALKRVESFAAIKDAVTTLS